jgi:hypothetical protein
MKGSPVLETIACLCLILALLIPLSGTAPVPSQEGTSADRSLQNNPTVLTWGSVRFSHPVSSARLDLNGQIFETGRDALGLSFEADLPTDGTSLVLEIEWPELTGRPFAQITMEPDGLETQTLGIWGKPGYQTRRWFVTPTGPE